jgi:hypothetical protein
MSNPILRQCLYCGCEFDPDLNPSSSTWGDSFCCRQHEGIYYDTEDDYL